MRKTTQRRSGPVRYELVSKDGLKIGPFDLAYDAVLYAERIWPGEEMDEDWDVQIVGVE